MKVKTSISELNMFDSCKRSWLYSRVSMKRNGSLVFGSAYQKAIELWGKSFLAKEALENKEYSDIKEKARLVKAESITKEKSIEIAQKWLLNPDFEFRTESNWKLEEYEPKKPNELYHILVDEFMRKNDYEPTELEINTQIQEMQALLPVMLHRYFNWFESNNFKWRMIEFSMEWLEKEFYFTIKPDALIEDEHGLLWILENKTTTKISTDHLEVDPQITSYLTFFEKKTGQNVSGVLWNQNRKAIEKTPKILNNGKLSTDKNQSTSAKLYEQAIIEIYGSLDNAPDNILETLNHLMVKKDFLEYEFITKNEFQKENTFNYIKQKTLELNKYKKIFFEDGFEKTFKACCPSFTRNCKSMCSYYKECTAYEQNKENIKVNFKVIKKWTDKDTGLLNIKIDYYGKNRFFTAVDTGIKEYIFKDFVNFEKEFIESVIKGKLKKLLNRELEI